MQRTPFGKDSLQVSGVGFDGVHYGPQDHADIGRGIAEVLSVAMSEIKAEEDDRIDRVAVALRDAANAFENPVYLYVQGEALRLWLREHPDDEPYDAHDADWWELEDWRILARAALAAS